MTDAVALRASHARLALGATVAAVASAAMLPEPGVAGKAAVLAVLVAVLGLPHGAVDHLEGRALLAHRAGRWWWLVFGALYVAAAAAVVAAWLAWPPGLLAGFLVLAAGHFGAEDVDADATAPGRPWRLLEVAVRGAIPVLGPVLFHPARTGELFAYLLPGTTVAGVQAMLVPVAWGAPAVAGGLAVFAVIAWAAGRRRTAGEVLALTAAVWVLPPLLAFVVYFCVWHAPRHTLTVAARLSPRDARRGLVHFGRTAWPLTLVTIAAGAAAWWALVSTVHAVPAVIATVFVGLAALTVPHVVLAALHARFANEP